MNNGMLRLGRGPLRTLLTAEQAAEVIEGAQEPLLLYPATPVERRDFMRQSLAWQEADAEPETPAPAEPAESLTEEQQKRETTELLERSVDRTGFLLWVCLRRGAPGMTAAARTEEKWNTDPQFWTALAEELCRLLLGPEAAGTTSAAILAQLLAVECGLLTLKADDSPKAESAATPT